MPCKKRICYGLNRIVMGIAFILSLVPVSFPARAAGPWYVAPLPLGNDSNSCLTTEDPCATINTAIAKANAGDTIYVALGTYTAEVTATEVVRITQSLILSGGWDDNFGSQIGLSVIDSQYARRGIYNTANPVLIDSFQIIHGVVTAFGGGVYNFGGTLTINNSIVKDNQSASSGGGLYNTGILTVNNSTIDGNTVGSGGSGGGGGGGIVNAGTLTLNNSTVSNNASLGSFPGVGIKNGSSAAAYINNSTISGNTSNTHTAEGIYNYSGAVLIRNSTITKNQIGISSTGGVISMQNTLVAGNEITTNRSDCVGTIASLGYNLIGINGCGFIPSTGDLVGTRIDPIDAKLGPFQDNGGTTFTHALKVSSPALNAGNPAVPGSGGSSCLATDQRGVLRPQGSACDIGAFEGSILLAASIIRSDPSPTIAPNLHFMVAFDGEVTGVDETDFVLTTTGTLAGMSISDMSGFGSNYSVTVATGTGVGTIRLDLIDDDSILDILGLPLGGVGPGNGDFTTGEMYIISHGWYVSREEGSSDGNSCEIPSEACSTINGAISKSATNDVIFVNFGTYVGTGTDAVAMVNKSLRLSGGWTSDFSIQTGLSIIDGQNTRQGIHVTAGPTLIENFQVTHGYSANDSGGISNSATLIVNNCLINANVSDWKGGGIYNSGTLTVNNSTIDGNRAGHGSLGSYGGGGLDNYGSSATATLNKTTVSNNTLFGSYDGSGIYNEDGTLILNNSTISGNSGGDGKGIYIDSGNVFLSNTTITANQTGGFRNYGGDLTMQNSIIAGNGTGSDCITSNITASTNSLGYNLVANGINCRVTVITGDQIGDSLGPIDAKLGPLQDNGGPTFTHALLVSSPAINAGNPASPGSGGRTCLGADQRSMIRPYGRGCDIGAFEVQFTSVKSSIRVDASPTRATTVHFTVAFSEIVTGVDTAAPFGDFSLMTTGLTEASITNVSGSGDAYTVTVNTGPGSGTLRLDVIDHDTILDESGQPLGGVGLTNGNYYSGQTYTIDRNGPTVLSSMRVDPDPAPAGGMVHFRVTFSEVVMGVDIEDFALTTTGSLSGMELSGVSGSGSIYTFSVNSGMGAGTLRLDVPASSDITDELGNLIEGLPYTGGEAYTVKYFHYFPLVVQPSVQSLYGKVTQAGVPVQGIDLELRFNNGNQYISLGYSATDAQGNYAFEDLPTLASGQSYYVRYVNYGATAGRLRKWSTREVYQYVSGTTVNIGDFDIADVLLPSNPDGGHISQTLPHAFQWTPRPATLTDFYEFDLYEPVSGNPYYYSYPSLGYTGSYILQALPSGFSYNTLYVWEVWIYGPDGGYGISNNYREVMFIDSEAGAPAPLPQSGPLPKPIQSLQDTSGN